MSAKVCAAILILLTAACMPMEQAKPTGSVGFTGIGGDRPVIYPVDPLIWQPN